MNIFPDIILDLKRDEGLRLEPYLCSAKKITIGYGRNLSDKGITQDEAERMLKVDAEEAMKEAWLMFGQKWWESIDEVRKRVIVNMVFNLGISRFKKFKKLIRAINDKDYRLASKEMEDSRWYTQVGNRAVRLVKMMETGKS